MRAITALIACACLAFALPADARGKGGSRHSDSSSSKGHHYSGNNRGGGHAYGGGHGGCGSRGGPGYRKPNGKCASWKD